MIPIGLLGGSFNPIHLGHLVVAEEARQRLGLERVLFVPALVSPHKLGKPLAPAEDRLRMVQLAIADNPAFEASDIELRRAGPSYSMDTVQQLRAQSDGAWDIHFLVGADTLPELPAWHRIGELADLCKFVVFSRPGESLDAFEPLRAALRDDQVAALAARRFEIPLIGISSTDIRRRAREGRSIRYLVPEAVRRYIVARGLYRE
ncbi:MAG TPA: nicotinate-nucleotide adenylyltransferase [Planctomycetota bacterium]|nr:nicotinate-nucleotide adenylyltransferase [Planctomycetota bacterium]HRR81012.1 nicotinate-nucleotide adenylyltransferase [Planctomycetota bacterium]HRT93612.1 nicotinate-nucleotide adenylyltransferase [Planctomycetota bacterium]